MDRLTGMAVFVKVVEGSSFAAAARHFRMSPAMVSSHVRAIEERIGARLLNRTTRRVSPTEVGQGYYERCVRILAEVEDAERAAGDANSTPRGVLRVSAPFTFGIAHVAPAVANYLAVYPDVSVELSLNDRYVDLIEDGVDVAIRAGQLPDSSLIARKLADVRVVLCASPRYLERHGAPQSPQDLAKHSCLSYSLSITRNEWRFGEGSGTPETVPVSGRCVANNGDVLRVLALKGEGIIRVPSYVVEEDIAAGRLVRLMPQYESLEMPVSAVYTPGRFLSAKVRAFVDFVAAHLDRTLAPHSPEQALEAAAPSHSRVGFEVPLRMVGSR
jgi:DNA-binding transcriptional LysR family regulator